MKTATKASSKTYIKPQYEEALAHATDCGLPVLLVGETGSGKTTIVRELAKAKGIELIRLNLTGQTGVDEFLGKYLVRGDGNGSTETYWVDGPIIHAMKHGMWVVLDEVNMANAEILSALHSLLDDDRNITLKEKEFEKIVPHKDFRLFATMNPEDEYVGTKELNKAFISRFPMIMHIDYSENEADILIEQGGVDTKMAGTLVQLAREVRTMKQKRNISYTCSTRDLIQVGKLVASGMKFSHALELAVINKAIPSERSALSKAIELFTGTKIAEVGSKNFATVSDMVDEIKSLSKEKDGWTDKENVYIRELNGMKTEIAKLKSLPPATHTTITGEVTPVKPGTYTTSIVGSELYGFKAPVAPAYRPITLSDPTADKPVKRAYTKRTK